MFPDHRCRNLSLCQFSHFLIRASQVEAAVPRAYTHRVKKLVSSLTLKNRNALPDLPHTVFPLERLFPGTNWTLNPSCQSLFPGLFQHSGLRGHRWAAWKSFRDAEHTVAVGHWTLAFFLKCQNPDFYCKTCSLQYSMSVSSRQESLWVLNDM